MRCRTFFALLAAPFVRLLGASAATIAGSSVGTAFFLWMTVFTLTRLNRRSGLDPEIKPWPFLDLDASHQRGTAATWAAGTGGSGNWAPIQPINPSGIQLQWRVAAPIVEKDDRLARGRQSQLRPR